MSYIIFSVILAVVYWDANILKKQNEPLYKEVFKPSKPIVCLIIVLSLLIVMIAFFDAKAATFLIFICIFPIYLLRREQFAKSNFSDKDISPLGLLSDAFGVIVFWFFSIIVIGGVLKGITDVFGIFNSELESMILSAVFSFLILFFLIYKASYKFSSQGFLINLRLRTQNKSLKHIIIIPIFIGLFFAALGAFIVSERLIHPSTPLNEILMESNSPLAILAFLAIALLVAPFMEEIVFRGYFYHVLEKVKGKKFTIFFIASSFAFLHVGQYWGDWLAIGMVTIMGFALTIIRAWSGSTLASVITHYVYNGGITLMPLIFMILTNPAFFKYKVYFQYHDSEIKEELLLESIQIQPDLADAYNDLAWLYTEEDKNLEEALRLIEKALSISPEIVAYLDTKAEVLLKLDRIEDSIIIRENLLERLLSESMKEYQTKKLREAKASL